MPQTASQALLWRALKVPQGVINVADIQLGILRYDPVSALPQLLIRDEPFTLGWGQTLDVHSLGETST